MNPNTLFLVLLMTLGVMFQGCATVQGVRDYFAGGEASNETQLAENAPITVTPPPVYKSETLKGTEPTSGKDSSLGSAVSGGSASNADTSATPGSEEKFYLPPPERDKISDTASASGKNTLNTLPGISDEMERFGTANTSQLSKALNPFPADTLVAPPDYSSVPVDKSLLPNLPESTVANQSISDFKSLQPPVSPLPGQQILSPPTTGTVRSGKPAPPVSGRTFDGQYFDLASMKGRVVVMDFWRTTCGPCIKALPKVEQLRRTYPENQLVIVGVNTDESQAVAMAFVKKNPHDWPQVHARSIQSNPLSQYNIRFVPTFVVVDQVGNIQYQGNNVDVASAKVKELVSSPSIASVPTQSANQFASIR